MAAGVEGELASRVRELEDDAGLRGAQLAGWGLGEALVARVAAGSGRAVWLDAHLCRLRRVPRAWRVADGACLVHAELSINYLEHVPRDAGGSAETLLSLDLSVNQIRALPNRVDYAQLRRLNLARNALRSVAGSVFSGTPLLEWLDLSSNVIESTAGLEALANLQHLNLRGNRVEEVTGLGALKSLESLDLGSNRLVDVLDLGGASALAKLDLSHNALENLEEVAEVVFSLESLGELKAQGNPICSERHYRLLLLENVAIEKLDNARVSRATRSKWQAADVQRDLEHVIDETTTHYMQWIEAEEQRKQEAIRALRKREAAIEAAFADFRRAMESELEECVGYVQELGSDLSSYETSFLGTKDGRAAWQRSLEHADKVRLETYAQEADKLRAEHDDELTVRADTESYIAKLRALSETRPAVWMEIKRQALGARAADEDQQAQSNETEAHQRRALEARLLARAEARNQTLLSAATRETQLAAGGRGAGPSKAIAPVGPEPASDEEADRSGAPQDDALDEDDRDSHREGSHEAG